MKRVAAFLLCLLTMFGNTLDVLAEDFKSASQSQDLKMEEIVSNDSATDIDNADITAFERTEDQTDVNQEGDIDKEIKSEQEDEIFYEDEPDKQMPDLEAKDGAQGEGIIEIEDESLKVDPTSVTRPSAVKNLKAVNAGSSIQISWSAVSGADGYIIYRKAGNDKFNYLYMVKGCNYSDLKPVWGKYNFYKVYPYKSISAGNRLLGSSVSYVYAKAVLPAVINLNAKAYGPNKILLSWGKVQGANGYLVYRQQGNGGMTYRYIVSGTQYIDDTASSSRYNFYRVYPYSLSTSGKRIVGNSDKYVYAKASIRPVSNLKASNQKGAVKITWKALKEVDGYIIYRKTGNGAFQYRYMVTKPEYLDLTASMSQFNYYKVYPYKNDANGRRLGISSDYVYGKAENPGQTIKNGIYEIASAIDLNMRIDIYGSAYENGGNANLWTANGGNNQKFRFVYLKNGYYRIETIHTKKVLDAYGTGNGEETNVHQYDSHGKSNQQWVVRNVGNGYYSIVGVSNGFYLDVAGGVAANGTNIWTYRENGSAAQRFKLIPTKENASSITITGSSAPTNLNLGSHFALSGIINASHALKYVTGGVYAADNGAVFLEKVVCPNQGYYDVSGEINNALAFGSLASGCYIYKLVAEDATDNKVTLINQMFNVYGAGINNSDVFVKQSQRGRCTLASAVMLLRRKAILNGQSYTDITEAAIQSIAWAPGLRYDFSYRGMSVTHSDYIGTISDKKGYLINMLNSRPEGVVIYELNTPHAVLLTDYDSGTDTFYAADPSTYAGYGRMTLNSTIISGSGQYGKINNLKEIWYIE